ncbi:MAG: serine/threonine-protein kinase [Sorangiineae bacterium]|nr:serine/threonine-protein kinase [Polyangiaceae bacterium]MEB2323099.1 serine/threonine-protein kinase [Sorangiineae bacterium]
MSAVPEYLPELDKYELLEELGHGGMATVYRARDRRLGRDVAVKIIHRHLRENREVAARFSSEARAVAKLRHPNIVEVYDVSDEDEAERFLVVELVRGTTLRRLIAERGHLPAEIAAALVLEIAAALEHAHERGVVHRDVKPENVLVEPPGVETPSRPGGAGSRECLARVKLTDFGIAKLLDAQGVTSTGQVLGSPAHMAPEQIEGGEVSAAADVFGAGVLLYECLVGKLPFDGKNPAQVLRRVLDGTYLPAERARRTVGARFSEIADLALKREAGERWASAAELAGALRAELSALGFDDPPRELAEYLRDPAGYLEAYEPRIVERLVARGKAARAAREPLLAAACFNRALAFRPDDVKLLSEVAGLARAARLRRLAARSAMVAGAGLLFGGLAFGVTRSLSRPSAGPLEGASARPPGRPAPRASASAERPIAAEPLGEPDARAPSAPKTASHAPLRPPTAPVSSRFGRVRVVIKGAGGGRVSVDGGPAESPFAKTYELTVGEHRFDFVPPNADCCEPPKPLSYLVRDTPDLQVVSYEIRFRPAVIQLSGPVGTELTCAALFAGRLTAPGQRQVLMNNGPTLEDSCTLFPPPGSGASPKQVDVTLRPGRTFNISWP